MSLPNSADINVVAGNTSGDDADEDRGKDFAYWVHGRNSISSRVSLSSPRDSSGSATPSQFSHHSASASPASLAHGHFDSKRTKKSKRKAWYKKKLTIGLVMLVGFFFLMNWWMLFRIQEPGRARGEIKVKSLETDATTVFIREELHKLGRGKKPQKTIYARLLAKAAHALAEGESKPEPKDLWVEPYTRAASWTPCSHTRNWEPSVGTSGFIMVTANGGINQQRVAVCNAVAVARLLNATLVLPRFMFSSVWRDASQFGDIYQEDYFIDYLKPDIRIIKELPMELQSLDLEAIGSMVTDTDIMKEAKPSFFLKYILPILHLNRVVHFVGFGNRLASDPVPHQLQMQLPCAKICSQNTRSWCFAY